MSLALPPRRLACLILISSIVIPHSVSASDWPTLLHDTGRSGRQPQAGRIASAPQPVATYDLGASAVGPILVDDLVGDARAEGLFLLGRRLTLQTAEGEMLWETETIRHTSLLAAEDVDGDGRKELLLTGYPPQLVVVSPEDGATLSRIDFHPQATHITYWRLERLLPDAAGEQFLIYLKREDDKGDVAGGWIALVDFSQGARDAGFLWQREIHLAAYPKTYMADANGDGVLEVIAQGHQEISALDARTGETIAHLKFGSGRRNYGFIEAVNLDEEPDDELVILTDESYPHMEVVKLGERPRVLWYRSLVEENYPDEWRARYEALPTSVGDFNADGRIDMAYSIWSHAQGDRWHVRVDDARTSGVIAERPGYFLRGIERLTADGPALFLMSREPPDERGIRAAEGYRLEICRLTSDGFETLARVDDAGQLVTTGHELTLRQYSNTRSRPRPKLVAAEGGEAFLWKSAAGETAYSLSESNELVARAAPPVPTPVGGPPRWQPPQHGNATPVIAADVTGDGVAEILLTRGDALVTLQPAAGEPWREVWRFAPVKPGNVYFSVLALDLEGDGRHEVLAELADEGPGAKRLGLIDPDGTLIREFRFEELKNPADSLKAWSTGDVNGDGRPDLIASLNLQTGSAMGKAGEPTVAVDLATGERLWTTDRLSGTSWQGGDVRNTPFMAPTVPVITFRDLNGDGAEEVLYGCNYFNFTVLNGPDGRPLDVYHVSNFIGEANSGYGFPVLADLDGDGRLEGLIEYGGFYGCAGAFTLDFDAPPAKRKLWGESYNSRNGVYMLPQRYMLPQHYMTYGIGDLDGDERAELLMPHVTEEMICRDGMTGRVLWRHAVGELPSTDVLVWDADGDGRDAFLFGTADGRLVALGAGGAVQWETTLPATRDGAVSQVIAADVLGRGTPQLIAVADGRVQVLAAAAGELAAEAHR